MHVSTEKAIALREKPPFDIIRVIVVPIAECQKTNYMNVNTKIKKVKNFQHIEKCMTNKH